MKIKTIIKRLRENRVTTECLYFTYYNKGYKCYYCAKDRDYAN